MKGTGASFAFAILLLTGCAGGGSSPSAAVPAPASGNGPLATAQIVIKIPPKSSSSSSPRKPAYVSPATQSITVQVDSGAPAVQNLSPGSPNCTSAGANYPLNCAVPVSASVGSHTVSFITYDQSNAAGNSLSANSIPVTFVAGQTPTIPVILAGVPASFYVLPLPGAGSISGSLTAGFSFFSALPQSILITALDAGGNFIVGPGAPAMVVSVTGASAGSGIAVSSANSSNPNQFALSATGIGSATLAISATPTSSLAGSALTANVPLTSSSLTTTIAGNPALAGFADGTGSGAAFSLPHGLVYNPSNGNLYVTDTINCEIRQVTTAGVVSTIAGIHTTCGFADGAGTSAHFWSPRGVAYDPGNGNLYVTDTNNCVVRQVTTSGVVTTIAGANTTCGFADGTGTTAHFKNPAGIAYNSTDGNLYVTDTNNCAIRQVTTSGIVTTIAGLNTTCGFADGTGTSAYFSHPAGLAYNSTNGNLYVADTTNCVVRQVTTAGVVTTIAGGGGLCGFADGTGTSAKLYYPRGITYDPANGNLYLTDTNSFAIRQVTIGGVVTTIAGSVTRGGLADGLGTVSAFNYPDGITYDSTNGSFYITDTNNQTIRQVQL